MKDIIIEIEDLVKSNKIFDALQKMQDVFIDDEISRNDVIGLISRYENLQNKSIKGIISKEDYSVGEAKIIHSILQLKDRHGNTNEKINHVYKSKIESSNKFLWAETPPIMIETFDHSSNSVFRNYDDNIWIGTLNDGTYNLRNKTTHNAVKYHHLKIGKSNMSDFPTTVEVQIKSSYSVSSCGLIFCYNSETKEYYSFTINNAGEYKLWMRVISGLKPIFAGRTPHIVPNDINNIGFAKLGNFIYLFVNDKYIRRIKENSISIGDSGIIAIGMGEFIFDNLSFYKL